MYAVTGSTGQVGSATVRELLRAGKQVRALLRNPDKQEEMRALGAQPAVASVEDPSALEAAFHDVEAVFVMTPPLYFAPDPRSEHRCALAALKHALQAAHVRRVVCLSSIGAEQEKGTGAILKLHDMEQSLFELPVDVASIRAAYFMENFVPMFPRVREDGELKLLYENLEEPIPMVATSDIGKLAAELLTRDGNGHRIFELEGPRRYSFNDVGSTFAALLHRDVTVSTVPKAEREAAVRSVGFSAGTARGLVEMAEGIDSGHIAFHGGDGVKHVQGATPLEAVYRGR